MKTIYSVLVLIVCFVLLCGCCGVGKFHSWEKVGLDNGVATYCCPNCSQSKDVNKTRFYQECCIEIYNELNSQANKNFAMQRKSNAKVESFVSDLYVNAEKEDYSMIEFAALFVEMLASMFDNPQFLVTDSPLKFTFSYAPLDEVCDAILLYDFDEENDKVVMHWNINSLSTISNTITNIVLYFEVDYDFVWKKVNGFEVYITQTYGESSQLASWIYNDGVLKKPDQEKDLTPIYSLVDEYNFILESKMEKAIDLKADFTKEYTEMMNKANPGLEN